MKDLFRRKKITEVIFFEEFGNDVKITMKKNECFEIRKYNPSIKYWSLCFETSSKCEWENAVNLAKSLIK